jgi:general L-amino acid transport system permease protein
MASPAAKPPRVSFVRNPRVRSAAVQALLLVGLIGLGWWLVANARANLAAQGTATGFSFLNTTAGFGITQTLISYSEADTYGRAFLVGLTNTLVISGIGIVLATLLGFMVGIARLSSNWLLARVAGAYVEVIRNLPLLFQILFWYLAVLAALPGPRQSYSIFDLGFLNARGLFVPRPLFEAGSGTVFYALLAGIVLAFVFRWFARAQKERTGVSMPVGVISLLLIIGLPLIAFVLTGAPISFELPELKGFNFIGGARVNPEFVALQVALVTYTAAFIGENVRAGILAIHKGQTEAAHSLGLRPGPTLRLVVIPQALRVITPPLTNQYLNLTKNSSLAVAIGYPDLFAVFAGTTLNQTGQAIEIIAMTMAVYLLISLVTSLLMNLWNRRMALVER